MKPKKLAIIGGVTGLLLAGTGVAFAAIPDSDDGELHACRVTGDAGNVRFIDKEAGQSCHSYETEVVIDTTPGISGQEIVSNTDTVPGGGGQYYNVVATCPSGKKVTGGGWIETVENNQPNLQVYQNYPVSSTSWKVRVRNDSGTAEDLTTYAMCVNG